MAATSYQSLLPYVLVEASGCPSFTAITAINYAARELCLISSCWQDAQDLPLVSGQAVYTVALPLASAVVRQIKSVSYDGVVLKAETSRSLNPALFAQAGAPTCYVINESMGVHLYPTPSVNEAGKLISVRASYIPALEAEDMPAALMDRIAETLIFGAKARVMMIHEKPFSNAVMAAHYIRQFDELVTKTRIEVELSYGSGSLSVTPVNFG